MADYYNQCTAENALKVSKEDYKVFMDEHNQTLELSGFSAEYDEDHEMLYFYSEGEGFSPSLDYDDNFLDDPDFHDGIAEEKSLTMWVDLGKLIEKAGEEYLEFGVAFVCSKALPGSFGGTAFRVLTSGEILWAERTWPNPTENYNLFLEDKRI